ncbi:MAG: hypothetical protein KDA20_08975 [Phycisphaerales bacterium]|nr:hypothetical protein [Phycisphaerales bacterium]
MAPAPWDQCCVECDYDLRGLGREGACPECGLAIMDSVPCAPFAWRDEVRSRARRGFGVIFGASIGLAVLFVTSLVFMFVVEDAAPLVVFLVGIVAYMGLFAWGTTDIACAREGDKRLEHQGAKHWRTLRYGPRAATVLALVGPLVTWSVSGVSSMFEGVVFGFGVLMIVSAPILLWGSLLSVLKVSELCAERVGSGEASFEGFCRIVTTWGPLAVFVLLIAWPIALLVALATPFFALAGVWSGIVSLGPGSGGQPIHAWEGGAEPEAGSPA